MLDLPVQVAVDRSVPYPPFVVEKRVEAGGTLLEILLVEPGGSFGSLPGDPPPWSRREDVGAFAGRGLSAYALALAGGRRGRL